MTRALVPIADGVEEMEAVIIIDVLRRADWEVTVASVAPGDGVPGDDPLIVRASRGVRLVADVSWADVDPHAFDAIVVPGGMGQTRFLSGHAGVIAAIRQLAESGKTVASICAAALVLQAAGVLYGRRATCHPSVREQLSEPEVSDERVVEDGNVVTSRGAGTALEFALALVRRHSGDAVADAIAAAIVM